MIIMQCQCGGRIKMPESSNAKAVKCHSCGTLLRRLCTENLAEGAGDGDFDAFLQIIEGPRGAGTRLFLGGCSVINLGRLEDNTLHLSGNKVSRRHARLSRVDFGPSRWKLADVGSSAGTYINGQKVQEEELNPGDKITIGEYTLEFKLVGAPPAPTPAFSRPVAMPASVPPPPPAKYSPPKTRQARPKQSSKIPVQLIIIGLVVCGVGGGGYYAYTALSEARKVDVSPAVNNECRSNLRELYGMLEQYKSVRNTYPATFGDLVAEIPPGLRGYLFCPSTKSIPQKTAEVAGDINKLMEWYTTYSSYQYYPNCPGGILVAEKKPVHKKENLTIMLALFFDGHIEELSPADLEAKLKMPPVSY